MEAILTGLAIFTTVAAMLVTVSRACDLSLAKTLLYITLIFAAVMLLNLLLILASLFVAHTGW